MLDENYVNAIAAEYAVGDIRECGGAVLTRGAEGICEEYKFSAHVLCLGTLVSPTFGFQDVEFDGKFKTFDLTRTGTLIDFHGRKEVVRNRGLADLAAVCIPFSVCADLMMEDEAAFIASILPIYSEAFYDDPLMDAFAPTLWRAAGAGNTISRTYIDQLLLTMLHHLKTHAANAARCDRRFLEDGGAFTDGPDFTLRTTERGRLGRTLDFIEAHLGTELCVADLAAEAAMSPSAFSRMFKAATGMPVWSYVMMRRLQRAAGLLRTTDLPISRIAQQIGFSSQAHLSTAFKVEFGATPGDFRRDMRP